MIFHWLRLPVRRLFSSLSLFPLDEARSLFAYKKILFYSKTTGLVFCWTGKWFNISFHGEISFGHFINFFNDFLGYFYLSGDTILCLFPEKSYFGFWSTKKSPISLSWSFHLSELIWMEISRGRLSSATLNGLKWSSVLFNFLKCWKKELGLSNFQLFFVNSGNMMNKVFQNTDKYISNW